MTARGGLHAITADEAEAAELGRPEGMRPLLARLLRASSEAVSGWRFAVLDAVATRAATPAVCARAWAAGFAYGLGGPRPPWWLSVLAECSHGTEAAWALRSTRQPAGTPERRHGREVAAMRLLMAEAGAVFGDPPTPQRTACAPLLLPAGVAAAAVVPARSRPAAGEDQATPGDTARRPAAAPRHAAARHAAPGRRPVVLRWLRRILPGAAAAPCRHGPTRLHTAA